LARRHIDLFYASPLAEKGAEELSNHGRRFIAGESFEHTTVSFTH